MPGDLGDALGHRLVVGERRFQRLHQQMAVEAEDLAEQFLAEAVHHRHDDDERRDAEHDAEEREAGDDRNESFLAAAPAGSAATASIRTGQTVVSRWVRSSIALDYRFHPILADSSQHSAATRRNLRSNAHRLHRVSRSIVAAGLRFSRLPSARRLTSNVPGGKPLGADQHLPGHADQVGGGEFRARPLVEVVVEHVDPLGGQSRDRGFRRPRRSRCRPA